MVTMRCHLHGHLADMTLGRLALCLLTIVCFWWLLSQRNRHDVITTYSPIIEGNEGSQWLCQTNTCCLPRAGRLDYSEPNSQSALSYLELFAAHSDLCNGTWRPLDCTPLQHVGIIIPYRDREVHLRLLLERLYMTLKHQNVAFGIYVIEQTGETPFNRGLLINIGIREALRDNPQIDCFIFHDVDLLPDNSDNLYQCDAHLRQLSSGIDEFRYHPPYANNAGGVSAMSRENLFLINGFPNRYWGWGNEDDELSARSQFYGLLLSRPPVHIGRYRAIRHRKSMRPGGHYDHLIHFQGYLHDGLTSLDDTSYQIRYLSSQDSDYGQPSHDTQHKERRLIHIPAHWSNCAIAKLASLLGLPQSSFKLGGNLKNASTHQPLEMGKYAARSVLYNYLSVDVSEKYRSPMIERKSNVTQSWLWVLHFFSWI